MNLRQLIADVLHKLPFVFAVISLMIYSSFVFWFERWRYNYIAALFVCYAVHLIVTSQPPNVPPPPVHVNMVAPPLHPLDEIDDDVGDTTDVDYTPPSIQRTVEGYWSEAVRNYRMYRPREHHFGDEIRGNLGHIRGLLPLEHDRFYGYIDSHIPVPDPWWALPYQYRVLFRNWSSVIFESLPYDEEIFIDNISDAHYLRTDIRLRLEEFAREQAQADLQADFISRQFALLRPGSTSQERERASDSGKGKEPTGKKDC